MKTVSKIALAADYTEEDLRGWQRIWVECGAMGQIPFAAFLRNPYPYLNSTPAPSTTDARRPTTRG